MSEAAQAPGPAVCEIKEKKAGEDLFRVVFEGDTNAEGRWVPGSEVPPDVLAKFNQKVAEQEDSAKKGRKIKQIRGIIPQGDDMLFVVRFRESTKDEAVPRKVMHELYIADLLKFYEANMERIPAPNKSLIAAAEANQAQET